MSFYNLGTTICTSLHTQWLSASSHLPLKHRGFPGQSQDKTRLFSNAIYSSGLQSLLLLPYLFWVFSPFKKRKLKGFPGGAVAESLPANAGDTGSSPGLGRSHMPRSNWAREPQLLSLHVWSLCYATREAVIMRVPCTAMKSGPHLPQLEKALAQKRRPNTAINKINK